MPRSGDQPTFQRPVDRLRAEDELATRLARLERQSSLLTVLGLALDRILEGDEEWFERAISMYEKLRRQLIVNAEAIDRLWDVLGGYDEDSPF